MKYFTSYLFIIFFCGISSCSLSQPISEIQGTALQSPFANKVVKTTGVVTYISFGEKSYNGFYIQSQQSDNNPVTSEGIFVFTDKTEWPIMIGDVVEVQATVKEYFGLTELTTVLSVEVKSKQQPTPVIVEHKKFLNTMEYLEGMYVSFTDTFVVCGNYNLNKLGQLELSSTGRLLQPTEIADINDVDKNGFTFEGKSNITTIQQLADNNKQSLLILDDGINQFYPAIIPFIDTINGTLRAGSKVTNLSGVVDFSYGFFRLLPIAKPIFDYAPRPQPPVLSTGNISLTSMNVLNYFTTFKQRGAKNQEEFDRQSPKLIKAMSALKTDVFALMEVENHPQDVSLIDIVTKLNNSLNADLYKFISTNTLMTGSDVIKVALIYNQQKIKVLGNPIVLKDNIFDRYPTIQTFEDIISREKFTVVAVHFKSKGCGTATGTDLDLLDGQGCWNEKRLTQSKKLIEHLTTFKDTAMAENIFIVGDFNAYSEEDPIDYLRYSGFKNVENQPYSYIYDNNLGALDHVIFSENLADRIVSEEVWHANADEPVCIDYNLENKKITNDYYKADYYRFSDHDPVIVQWKPKDGNVNGTSSATINNQNIRLNSNNELLFTATFDNAELEVYNLLGQQSLKINVNGQSQINLKALLDKGWYQLTVLDSKSKKFLYQSKIRID
jgi:predicted extracellular nuclease